MKPSPPTAQAAAGAPSDAALVDAAAASAQPPVPPRLPRVLFVDDEPELRALLGWLARGRFELHCAGDGRHALQLIEQRGPFDVAVCDYRLPDLDGVALLQQVRRQSPTTARILLTGQVDPDIPAQAVAEGEVFRFLSKPIPPRQLIESIEAGLRDHERSAEQQFVAQSMGDFARSLDRQLACHVERVHELLQFSAGLNAYRSLQEVAEATAQTITRMLGGRPAAVSLCLHAGSEKRCWIARAGEPIPGSAHIVPLTSNHGGWIGELRVALEPRGPLQLEELRILQALASGTAIAANEQMRRKDRDLAQQAAIQSLARLAERRDNETGKHLERVSEYCRVLAESLRANGEYLEQIDEEYIDDLVRSAPLHDIGKVGIPDRILLKAGKLDEQEWAIMRTHPTIGAETLRSVVSGFDFDSSFLRLAGEIALCHHEKWNGSGYPAGLAGQAIPLSARIVALADCYDALTSERPYKRAWTHAQAMAWLGEQAGQHFEPALVAAFQRRSREVEEIRERLGDPPAEASSATLAA